MFSFVKHCGMDEDKIRFRQHLKNEMAHYANECWDLGIIIYIQSFNIKY